MPYYSGKINERPTILCPCPPPKRLLTSTNWICRNDSSSVNAILHPEINLVSPRLKYAEKTKGDVIAKHILGRNNCYCTCKNKKLPKPTFFKRPSTCVSYEGGYKCTNRSSYEDDLKRESIATCVCNESQDHLNVPEPLKSRLTRLKQSKSAPEGLKYSDQRKKYGEYREAQEERYADEVQGYRNYEIDLMAGNVNKADGGDSEENINTILGIQNVMGTSTSNGDKYGTTTTVSKPSEESDYNSFGEIPKYVEETVPDFRNEHYFETHYIGKVSQTTGSTGDGSKGHVCVHQFRLDRRWLPDPVSMDNFGRSLCKFCDKPMEGSSFNLSSGYLFSEDGMSKSKLKNYAEAYQSGLMPKKINLSKGKSKIELVIKESDIAELGGYFSGLKQPVYCNSLALRQQRMRLI